MEEARENNQEKSRLYSAEPIPLAQEDGVTAIAFALPDLLRQFGGRMRELALDSTCKQSDSGPIIN
jgi:hypothetical protein